MLQCNLTLHEGTGIWASQKMTIIHYLVMVLVAGFAFAGNFSKKKSTQYTMFGIATLALIAYCVIGYLRGTAETVFAVFPLLAVAITPMLGKYVDTKGKAATMLVIGSVLLIICHLIFAFVLPMFKGNAVGGLIVAYATILVLGASFSLVPAALWPSVPKLVDEKIIGSAYALIFWIQNIGLWLFPTLIGKILNATNSDIIALEEAGEITSEQAAVSLDYTVALVVFAVLGVAALIFAVILKGVDRKKHIGLEEPNIK